MDLLAKILGNYGFNRYEVNSFAKERFQAKHNQIYWTHGNYLGLGPGSHSFWWPKTPVEKEGLMGYDIGFFRGLSTEQATALRWSNPKDLMGYIHKKNEYQKSIYTLVESISELSLAEEYIWLGLRTSRGFDRNILAERYNYKCDAKQQKRLESLVKDGKIRQSGESFSLTREGVRIADYIALDLLS
jgi:oxygen-independent coproporphyrinogen-3 oxidase